MTSSCSVKGGEICLQKLPIHVIVIETRCFIFQNFNNTCASLFFCHGNAMKFTWTWKTSLSCHSLDNHTFNRKISNRIFNCSSGGLMNHQPGLKYIVTKSRCTMALTPPRWNSQNLSNQISRTESYQEVITTALVKLAKRNKWKSIFLHKKTKCSHSNIHHEEIKTWEVYKTPKHHKQFRCLCIWQANNTNTTTYELTFARLEWLKSHNTKHVRPKMERLINYCNAWHSWFISAIRLLDSL